MKKTQLTDEAICQLITSTLPKSARKRPVTPSMDLRTDLGVDSIGLMSIVFLLEQEAGVDVFSHVQEFISAERVSDIIGIVRQNRTAAEL
jgi:acyl carrier protein